MRTNHYPFYIGDEWTQDSPTKDHESKKCQLLPNFVKGDFWKNLICGSEEVREYQQDSLSNIPITGR